MDSPPVTIAVVSQVWSGHIPAYHALLVEKLRAQGCRVLSLSPAAPANFRSSSTEEWWRPWHQSAAFGAPPPPGFILRRAWNKIIRATGLPQAFASLRLWRETAGALRRASAELEVPIDGVVLVYLGLGYCEHLVPGWAVDAVFPYRWTGILNGPSPVRPAPFRPTLTAWLGPKERVLRAGRCESVLLTDVSFCAPCAAAWPGVRLRVTPEMADLAAPHPDDTQVAGVLRFAAGRRLVGLLGNIAARKGVRAFLEIARLAEKQAPEICFLLAGEFSAASCPPAEYRELAALIAQRPDNCLFRPERIAEGADFNGLVKACDVVYAAYREFPFNSNLLTKAAHFRRPAVVSSGGVMAELVTRYRTGEVIAPDDSAATLAALRNLPVGRDSTGRLLEPDYAGLCALNSADRLEPVLREILVAWSPTALRS